jgi:hypothetical protein
MKIKIETQTIVLPKLIEVDGKKYPITPYNVQVVMKYWETKNEDELKNLKDISLDLGGLK